MLVLLRKVFVYLSLISKRNIGTRQIWSSRVAKGSHRIRNIIYDTGKLRQIVVLFDINMTPQLIIRFLYSVTKSSLHARVRLNVAPGIERGQNIAKTIINNSNVKLKRQKL